MNFYAIDPEKGIVYQYREYYKADTLVPEHAAALKPLIEDIPLGKLRFMVADPSIANRTDPIKGKSVQALYQEYGLHFRAGNNSIEAGILKVNSYIERGRLKVFRSCVNTIKEGLNYKFPELSMDDDRNLDEKPEKKNDHSMDSMRYGMMLLPDDPDLLKNESYNMPTTYRKKEYEQDLEEYEEEMEGDFLSYV